MVTFTDYDRMCSSTKGGSVPGPSTPYVASESPNAEWDFGAIGTPTSQRVPKLQQLFMWNLPSFADPVVFNLLYGHNEGLTEYLSILQRRSIGLQAQSSFGKSYRNTTKPSIVYTPPGILPNLKAIQNYKPMTGRTSPYTSPPIRIDYGPVGTKLREPKLISDLPDLVKDIRFVNSMSHIRENPHFSGNQVIIGEDWRRTQATADKSHTGVVRIPALIVDLIRNTLVLNRKAIPESRIVLTTSKSPKPEIPTKEEQNDVETESETDSEDDCTLSELTKEFSRTAVESEGCSSDSLESISSAWSEKSLDYESISSGRLSIVDANQQHVKSAWDSTSKSSFCDEDESTCEEDGYSSISSSSSSTTEALSETDDYLN